MTAHPPAAPPRPAPVRPPGALAGLMGAAAALAAATLALLQEPAGPPATAVPGMAGTRPCPLGADGAFSGQFYGGLDFAADWSGSGLACDGMARPGGGFRLYFAGPGQGTGRVTVLIGLERGSGAPAEGEQPANVTVIDEQAARFFNSGGQGRCWADIAGVSRVVPGPAQPGGRRIDGVVYCLGALPSVGDRASLTLGDLRFSGWIGNDS